MGRLDDKVAVVTGAGNGIGRAHAIALAAEGAKVLVNDVGRELVGGKGGAGLVPTPPDISVAQRVVDEINARGGVAVANAADVSSVEAAAGVVNAAVEAFGDLDIVVNNAGTIHDGEVEDIDDERLDKDISVNIKGTAGTIKAAFEVMKRHGHGGSIINTMTGFGGYPAGHGLAGYNAAKYAVVSWTLHAAAAGREHGIRVNAYCPTAITRQSKHWFFIEGWIDEADEATLNYLSPEKMPPLVVFLASDAARELTGRLFHFIPTSLGVGAPYMIQEVFVAQTDPVIRDTWTVDDVEEAIGSITRTTSREGDWTATIDALEGIPAAE